MSYTSNLPAFYTDGPVKGQCCTGHPHDEAPHRIITSGGQAIYFPTGNLTTVDGVDHRVWRLVTRFDVEGKVLEGEDPNWWQQKSLIHRANIEFGEKHGVPAPDYALAAAHGSIGTFGYFEADARAGRMFCHP